MSKHLAKIDKPRFHGLPDFDGKKRSCRKRLADHNTRCRKPHQETIQFNSRSIASSYYDSVTWEDKLKDTSVRDSQLKRTWLLIASLKSSFQHVRSPRGEITSGYVRSPTGEITSGLIAVGVSSNKRSDE